MSFNVVSSSADHATPLFEIKSNQLSTVALVLKSTDFLAVSEQLMALYGPQGESFGFFDDDPVVLDGSSLIDQPSVSLQHLMHSLRDCKLRVVAARSGDPAWESVCREQGLPIVPQEQLFIRKTSAFAVPDATSDLAHERVREVVREVPGPATMIVEKPLRSGQKLYARGCDLVVLAMVNQGAEIAADGNIHVYAPLRGKAMAGARGNTTARIFSLCLEPELISIAGVYRTSEVSLPVTVKGKAAQARLSADGQERLLIEPFQ